MFAKWKTRDGKKIKIRKMDDVHLMNTIKMLERRYEQNLLADNWEDDGVTLIYCAHESIFEMFEAYRPLTKEARRRKIYHLSLTEIESRKLKPPPSKEKLLKGYRKLCQKSQRSSKP